MSIDNEELDQATAEYYNLLFACDTDDREVSTEDLVRFLAHHCTAEEEESILEALLDSSSLREEMIQIQTQLQHESWSSLNDNSEIKRSFLTSIREGFDALAGRMMDQSVPTFVWQSVGREWRQILGAPRFASVRGSESTIGIKGTEKQVQVKADVVEGDLIVQLSTQGIEVNGPVWLSIHDPGGAHLPLWNGELESEPTTLSFPQLGTNLGFDNGPVPNVLFSLSLERELMDQSGAIDFLLANGQTLRLPLVQPISVRDNILRIQVDLSNFSRSEELSAQFIVEMGSIKLILGRVSIPTELETLKFEAQSISVDTLEIAGTSLIKMIEV